MPRIVFEYDPPERFVAGTVGEPGQRREGFRDEDKAEAAGAGAPAGGAASGASGSCTGASPGGALGAGAIAIGRSGPPASAAAEDDGIELRGGRRRDR